ncbi:MAG: pyruvate dehydrogenase (acetyl-transferring), homodimeric type, partial [Acidobacteria bacterium]|nr:pyruvate dehydrogenase (acetyl-transferring), homodimeric type [Acidobacteriota bacterium]
QKILEEQFQIITDVWSVTSYNELRRNALFIERFNRLHPDQTAQRPYINQVMDATEGPIIAATDYMKLVPDQLAPWLGNRLVSLGTDGFGRSESREYLRRFFEMDANSIAAATLSKLAREGKITVEKALKGFAALGVNPDVADPATV